MNKKLMTIFVSLVLIFTFFMPKSILANSNETMINPETDKIQLEELSENHEESNEANNEKNDEVSTYNDASKKTAWLELVEKIASSQADASINIDKNIEADPAKDKQTILIKNGQNIVLKGNGSLKGFGFNSIKIEKGGSLTIDGTSISNAQIIVEGKLNIKSGKISDTKLEGPNILVKGGDFTMSGGEFSGNEAVDSQNPQPDNLRKTGKWYSYAPITLYGGGLNISGGKISNNKGFYNGGAIGAWGTDTSKINVKISGGEITENVASHNSTNAWGGAIFMENAEFEMTAGTISKNTAEYGGGLLLSRSNAKISGGSISENSNGEYSGLGGGVFGLNSDIIIEAGDFTKNKANGHGGGLFLDTCNFTINGGHFVENSSLKSGGAIATVGTSKGQINAGLFESNNSNGFWGGGAIYNDTKCELTINRALIKNNESKGRLLIGAGNKPISRQGGGVWNCPTGHTIINITNGVALFDNIASNLEYSTAAKGSGDDFENITKYEFGEAVGSSSVKLASRMLGGGYRLWYQDGSFQGIHNNWPEDQQTPRYNPENPGKPLPYNIVIEEKKGAQLAYKSVPTQESKNLAEQVATTIFKNNFAQGTGISGGAITNNGKLIFGEDKPYKIQITKSWSGDDEKTRPEEIVLQMYVGEHYIQDIKLTKEGNWTATIEDFPDPDTLIDNKTGKLLPINFKEKDSGKYILSEVKREKDSKESIYTIHLENSLKTSIKVNKIWNDNNNQAGLRSDSITVALLANGKETGKTIELNKGNDWKGKFNDLPSHNNGELIKYTIKEVNIANGYTSTIEGDITKGYTIKNSYIPPQTPPEKTEVGVEKIWKDENNADGKRPEEITVHLYKNGQLFQIRKISGKDGWKVVFKDLDKYEDDKEILYTIKEEKVEGYTGEVSGNAKDGFVLTNKRKPEIPPEKTEVGVEKIWKDENNADGKRPEEITVHLYKNGQLFQIRKISGKDGWKVVFKDLDKYEDDKEILYTIKEEKVEGYTGEVSGNAKEGFVLTNTRKPETPPEEPKKPKIPSTGDNISLIHYEMLVLSIISLAYIFRKRKINRD